MLSFDIIPSWWKKKLTCAKCGETRSVKYKVNLGGTSQTWCNKCVFENLNILGGDR